MVCGLTEISSFSANSISSLLTQQDRGILDFTPSLWRVISWFKSPKRRFPEDNSG